MATFPAPQSLRYGGRRAEKCTRSQISPEAQPPPPLPPPVRTPAGGKVASQSWSPPACWSSLLQDLLRRNSCRRKLTTRARSPPPLPHHPSLTGGAPWFSPRTHCPPPLTAPRTRTLSWAPVLTARETTLHPSPPPPALCPARAGSLVPFIQLLPLSSSPPNSCHARPLESHLAVTQWRAGN